MVANFQSTEIGPARTFSLTVANPKFLIFSGVLSERKIQLTPITSIFVLPANQY